MYSGFRCPWEVSAGLDYSHKAHSADIFREFKGVPLRRGGAEAAKQNPRHRCLFLSPAELIFSHHPKKKLMVLSCIPRVTSLQSGTSPRRPIDSEEEPNQPVYSCPPKIEGTMKHTHRACEVRAQIERQLKGIRHLVQYHDDIY